METGFKIVKEANKNKEPEIDLVLDIVNDDNEMEEFI